MQFFLGFIVGAYSAQKYSLPNIENIFDDILSNLKKLEKNEGINQQEEQTVNEPVPENVQPPQTTQVNEEIKNTKKKSKFFF